MKSDDAAPCERGADTLAAYEYEECSDAEREQLELHLATCSQCTDALASLRTVRGALGAWTPPEPSGGFRVVARDEMVPSWSRMLAQPGWLAAAAAVVLVVGVASVGVEVRHADDGFAVRVGRVGATPSHSVDVGSDVSPWETDLARLEEELRRDFGTTAGVDELLVQIEDLIAQSERRQQQEVALRLTELAREFDVQRLVDQPQMQQEFRVRDGATDYLWRTSSAPR